MAGRKDSKGRVLKTGESQRQDGRYVYFYQWGDKRKALYSWTLNPSDKIPTGKKADKSLREKEEEIQKRINAGIVSDDKITVKELVFEYCDNAVIGKSASTKHMYNTIINHLQEQIFWNVRVVTVKRRQAKKWIRDMMYQGIGYFVLCRCKAVLKGAFDLAVDDEIIVRNVFDFKMPEQEQAPGTPKKRTRRNALTQEQENELLNYCKTHKVYNRWYYVIVILLGTGLRISEFLGLTFDDVDLDKGLISVNHQITCYYNKNGKYKNTGNPMQWATTKTESGTRQIPINEDVSNAFKWLYEHRKVVQEEYEISGSSGFIFLNNRGRPSRSSTVDLGFKSIISAYNKEHEKPLPNITPHVLRHTFCTNMVYKGMNQKNLQYIMGHNSARMTMDVYSHVNADMAIKEMRDLNEKVTNNAP